MMKHRKIFLGTFILIAFSLAFNVPNVYAATKCSNKGIMSHFGFNVKTENTSDGKGKVVISVTRDDNYKFKVVKFTTLEGSQTHNDYLFKGNNMVITGTGKFRIELGLVNDYTASNGKYHCYSYDHYYSALKESQEEEKKKDATYNNTQMRQALTDAPDYKEILSTGTFIAGNDKFGSKTFEFTLMGAVDNDNTKVANTTKKKKVCKYLRGETDKISGLANKNLRQKSAKYVKCYMKYLEQCDSAKDKVLFNYTNTKNLKEVADSVLVLCDRVIKTSQTQDENYKADQTYFKTLDAKFWKSYNKTESLRTQGKSKEVEDGITYHKRLAGENVYKTTRELKCQHTDMKKVDVYDANGKYNIKANTDIYAAQYTYKKNAEYTYNPKRDKGGKAISKYTYTETKNICDIDCKEVVEVNYGPPIASKAGLCFEYQVQVTSILKCNTIMHPENTPTKPNLCSPIPYCNNIPGYTTQAGGNEEFDSCINSCDGGKYTSKCSNKCYKQVYKQNGNTKLSLNNDYSASVENVSTPAVVYHNKNSYVDNDSHYYWRTDRGIWWWSGTAYNDYARYYWNYGGPANTGHTAGGICKTASSTGCYKARWGFKWHVSWGGALCGDSCSYTNCRDSKAYTNREDIEADMAENMKTYRTALAECNAAATCTEKTAFFKISMDYTKGDGNKQTISFPYTENKPYNPNASNSLTTSEKPDNCATNASHTNEKDRQSVILHYDGCYRGCGTQLSYHTRWSFPGTWVNNKTGEISYIDKSKNSDWSDINDKVCLPLDAQNVNEKWWDAYYKTNYYSDNYFNSENCKNKVIADETTNGNANATPTYNIHAKVKGNTKDENDDKKDAGFGYFGWKINIECFYALHSKITPSGEEDVTCTNVDYNIRPVDTADLFPGKDGNTQAKISSSNTGRTPGFNWSEKATNYKNPEYLSNPKEYLTFVQKLNYSIYHTDYLDYKFELSPDDLKWLHDQVQGDDSKQKYNTFSGSIDENGNYVSSLFREGGRLYNPDKNIVPHVSLIKCNNIDQKTKSCAIPGKGGEY